MAAKNGFLPLCQMIIKSLVLKNPKDRNGLTPLHLAAKMGHLRVCELLIDVIKDKNPRDMNGITPLHLAAQSGHLSVCQFIVDNVNDKNIKSPEEFHQSVLRFWAYEIGMAPLHLAARNGHLQVCQWILEIVKDQHPGIFNGRTPQQLAIHLVNLKKYDRTKSQDFGALKDLKKLLTKEK